MTEDFTRIFLTPIVDIDYYLPQFSKFEVKNLFRSQNRDNLIQISKLTNLCLQENEKEENTKKILEEKTESQNLNSLHLLRESEYKYMDELNKDIMGSLSHYSSTSFIR